MPIPYRDVADLEDLGAAAFLKVEPAAGGGPGAAAHVGALFLVNARGEPLEFVYNRIEIPRTFLWRATVVRRHAARRLTTSLLDLAERMPRLLLCLADEVDETLFDREIQVPMPVGRLAPVPPTSYTDHETGEIVEHPLPPDLVWTPGPPAEGSPERALFDTLSTAGLLLEPFERASLGLREVFGATAAGGGR